ncbi:MAG: autotransporter outer membrane beta-barrel domain-containing protein [Methylacidiphilales bacterium]|nr:autotransporter outer membrane beta-barrel domain-containing protein [Candidatus Methylacidiphilales bacterium]
MKNLSIPSLVALAILLAQSVSAQTIVNGSFEDGFTGWSLAGTPSISTGPPTPIAGSSEALVNSTGATAPGVYNISNSVSAATLATFANTTLPLSSNGSSPVNGEAIQQTFTIAGNANLTFSYSYQSRENPSPPNGFDVTGYVLNGTFHSLADTTTPGQTVMNIGFFIWGLPYQTVTIPVSAGSNTLTFITYNTFNTAAPSGLFLDDIYLTSLIPVFASVPGLTPNQTATAQYIDTYSNTVTGGNFGALVTNLTNLAGSPASLGSAFDQISPQSLQVFRHIAFDNAAFTTQNVTDHLANLRDGLTGFDDSHITVTDPTLSPTLSQINSRLLAWNPAATPGLVSDAADPVLGGVEMKEVKPAVSEPVNRWSSFISGNVILADLSHSQDLSYQNYTTGSVMLGTDYRLDSHFTVGALFAYGHTSANLDENGSSATVDSYSPGVYASYVDGGWYGNALFAYTYNSYTEDRNINIGTLAGTNRGAPQGNQYTGNLTGGYEFHYGHLKIGPTASAQYVNLGINSFSEQGPTALNVSSQSDQSFRSQLGLEARYAVQTGSVLLTPHLSATWQHEFLDNSNGITSQFNQIGSGSFTVQTTQTERNSAFIDAGLDADVVHNVTLFTDYQTEVGQANYFGQSVQAGVKISY